MDSRSEGFLLVLITALISGVSIFINKFGVSVSGPYLFTTIKNAAVALIFLFLILSTKEHRKLKTLSGKQWKNLLAIGFVGGSVPFLLFFKGLSLTSAAQAGFIHKTLFIYASILSIIFLKEKVGRGIVISSSVLLSGLFLLSGLPSSFGEGDALVLAATLFWAAENVLSKNALKSIPPNIVVFGRMAFGLLILVPFTLVSGDWSLSLNPETIAWTAITSVFLFGYTLTYYHGLRRINVSEATSLLLLGSAITTTLDAMFVNNTISASALSGVFFLILGVLWINRGTQKCVYPLRAQ